MFLLVQLWAGKHCYWSVSIEEATQPTRNPDLQTWSNQTQKLYPKKHVWTGKFVWGGLESLFIFCGLGSLFQSKLDTVFILDMFRFFFGGEDFLNFVELKIRFNLVGKCGCG